ncbi:MAG: transporter substrate-binding domain-containing protein [Ruminococcaceae bacterium]|nr:transporter substrate-binding domain-containing protein [Oscillospiraceae bacterium]
MKKILSLVLCLAMMVGLCCSLTSCGEDEIIVQTNAFFAPFEYYKGTDIVGVDVEIMNKVAEKMGKTVTFKNVEFSAIIDNVAKGEVCDAGAAGITITDERKEKVDFSTPYYTSVQYVIYAANSDIATKTGDNGDYIVWDALKGKTIGVQTDTTGWIYADGEINATEDNDYGYAGVLYGTNTELKNFDNAQLAADGIGSNMVDVVIIDELPAQFITDKNSNLKCLPLYYSGAEGEADAPVEEQYAICVTKGNTELLNAINEVLKEMMDKGEIEKLVMKHMGME